MRPGNEIVDRHSKLRFPNCCSPHFTGWEFSTKKIKLPQHFNKDTEGTMSNLQISAEDKKMFAEMDHFSNLKDKLGYDTVWSIESGLNGLDWNIFSNKPRKVSYTIIDRMGETFDDVDWVTFRSVAENGTIGALWKAAEDCFQQAKENNGDWHIYIEDFELQEDGSLKLITGS